MFSGRPLSVHAELRIEKDFWSRTIGGKVGGGPVAPCASACGGAEKVAPIQTLLCPPCE